MTRLLAYSEKDVASLSFYHCDCGIYYKALQEQSCEACLHPCECGSSVLFYGRLISLWKTRNIESLFGTGWIEVPIQKERGSDATLWRQPTTITTSFSRRNPA